MRALLLLSTLTLLPACATPQHDRRDRQDRTAVHLVYPAWGDFRTSGALPVVGDVEEHSQTGNGIGVQFEWGTQGSRTLAASALTFGVRQYQLEAEDPAGNRVDGEMLEFAFGYRAYPDLGVDDPTVQPYAAVELLLIPFVDIGEVDLLGFGAAVAVGAEIWLTDDAGFELSTRLVGAVEDLLRSDRRFHHGVVVEAALVVWL